MSTAEEYDGWFRFEAMKLPDDARRSVLYSLEHREPRQIFQNLNRLMESRALPESWASALTDYFGRFCK